MAREIPVRIRVNGEMIETSVTGELLLLDFLRDRLGLTGTKEGCSVGVCGACTVLVDDRTVSSCLMPAVLADGREVWTVEGLASRLEEADRTGVVGELLAIQRAFIAQEGLQCGICTPGQIVSAYALLRENPHPTREEACHWMAGNLCRCTGYQSILRAIAQASGEEVESEDAAL